MFLLGDRDRLQLEVDDRPDLYLAWKTHEESESKWKRARECGQEREVE